MLYSFVCTLVKIYSPMHVFNTGSKKCRWQNSVDNKLRRQSQPPSAASRHRHGKYYISSCSHAAIRFSSKQGIANKLCRILLFFFNSLCFNGNPISFSSIPNHHSRLDPKPQQRHAAAPSTSRPWRHVPSATACSSCWSPPTRSPLVLPTEASTGSINAPSSTTNFVVDGRNG